MELMERIKTLRKAKGWTQTELGKRIGVIQKVIADYETGNTKPPIERLPVLADVLGVSVDELLRGDAIQTSVSGPETQVTHGNSRVAKIQDEFEKLKPADQRAVLKMVKGLAK